MMLIKINLLRKYTVFTVRNCALVVKIIIIIEVSWAFDRAILRYLLSEAQMFFFKNMLL